ncbi:DinB family protein [Ktedonobacter racemifer]|uniref:DinB family protein n=1 Tax=Ktedonobacter racemifer DSM 44963 TaxID=485913 RepID=D6TW77_KTERA|nr:DinB family protein [Ktedonobacter racemifer]EFH84460.1 DinB family protein [Ktedonobacter racemifer DSM 44963]
MTTRFTNVFKQHLWANLQLLETCSKLSEEQLDATAIGTYGSIRETLKHLFAAEERYTFLLTGQRSEPELSEEAPFVGFNELQQRACKTGEALIALAEDGEENQVIHLFYDEQDHEVPAFIVLIQALNHATDHRSQIATLLSLQGMSLPQLDGWSYYRAMS